MVRTSRSHAEPRFAGSGRVARIAAVGAILGAATGGVTVGAWRAFEPTPDACSGRRVYLRVVAAPEIAPVVESAARIGDADERGCSVTRVESLEPAAAAAQLRSSGRIPDVWIPDSSMWLTGTSSATGVSPAVGPSLAMSPFVLSVRKGVAARLKPGSAQLSFGDLIPARGGSAPARWALPDPDTSMASVAALVALRRSVATRADAATVLTGVVGTSVRTAGEGNRVGDLARAAASQYAVPSTEQQVAAHNATFPGAQLVMAYPSVAIPADYPYLTLATDPSAQASAHDLLTVLRQPQSRKLLQEAGFRAAAGDATNGGGEASAAPRDSQAVGAVPSPADIGAARRAWTAIARPSRLLAVIDVSGSMGEPVPQARGLTRLDLAVQAAMNALALYPDDTVAGLWIFSTGLTPRTDYRSLVPPIPLGPGPDGVTGRQRLSAALTAVRPTTGWTGLYDTTLAAMREMRRTWDPARANSVVIITDGGNQDPAGGLDLPTVLRTLRRENDPHRPVPLFAISYGPAGDLAVLRQLAEATGGKAYSATDPRMIGAVLRDAIGRRGCAPGC